MDVIIQPELPIAPSLEWLNDNPDKAVELLPEVVRYIVWRRAPFIAQFNRDNNKVETEPAEFYTRTGRNLTKKPHGPHSWSP